MAFSFPTAETTTTNKKSDRKITTNPAGKHGIISHIKAIEENEAFQDVQLRSTNGGSVPASRIILAARSPVFERMFFGNFAERSAQFVQLDFATNILKIVVHFCYCDEIKLDEIYSDDSSVITATEAKDLVNLRQAANFFQLRRLRDHITIELCDLMMKDQPATTCTILDEAMWLGEDGGPLWDAGRCIIECDANNVLMPTGFQKACGGLTVCSHQSVAKIFDFEVEPTVLISALQMWVDHDPGDQEAAASPGGDEGDKGEDESTTQETESESRLSAGMKLAKKIDLRGLTGEQLAAIEPGKLFSMEQLYTALCKSVGSGGGPAAAHRMFGFGSNATFGPTHDCLVVILADHDDANGYYIRNGRSNFTKVGDTLDFEKACHTIEETNLGGRYKLASMQGIERVVYYDYEPSTDKDAHAVLEDDSRQVPILYKLQRRNPGPTNEGPVSGFHVSSTSTGNPAPPVHARPTANSRRRGNSRR